MADLRRNRQDRLTFAVSMGVFLVGFFVGQDILGQSAPFWQVLIMAIAVGLISGGVGAAFAKLRSRR